MRDTMWIIRVDYLKTQVQRFGMVHHEMKRTVQNALGNSVGKHVKNLSASAVGEPDMK